MSALQDTIQFIVNAALTAYNTFRINAGIWYVVFILCAFILPLMNKLIAKIRGVK